MVGIIQCSYSNIFLEKAESFCKMGPDLAVIQFYKLLVSFKVWGITSLFNINFYLWNMLIA